MLCDDCGVSPSYRKGVSLIQQTWFQSSLCVSYCSPQFIANYIRMITMIYFSVKICRELK